MLTQHIIPFGEPDPAIAALRRRIRVLEHKVALYEREEDLERQLFNKCAREEFQNVFRACSTVFKVPISLILSRTRFQIVVDARRVAMVLLYERLENVSRVGRLMNRNHGTVLFALRRARELSDLDPEFRARFDKVRALCKSPKPA